MKFSRPVMSGLKLLLTLLLLILVFRSVDISRIGRDIGAFDAGSLALLVVLYWTGQLLCSERWRIFAASLQMNGSYLSFVQMYFAGMFFNIGLPSLIGGDVIKAFIVSRKNGKPLQTGLASVLQDRAAGLISLLIYGTAAILAHPLIWRRLPLLTLYLLAWAGTGFALWAVLKGEKLYSRFLEPGSPTLFQKALRNLAGFHRDLGGCRLSRGALLRIAVYSLLNSALVLLIFHQVTAAAGHRAGLIAFSALFPMVTLATMIPVTISGLGIREWVYVEALSLVGIPRDAGLVISLATSAMLLLCNLAGIFFLPGIPVDLRRQAYGLSKNAGPS